MNSFTMQIKGKSKPRPRVTRKGTYNDPKYTTWKKEVSMDAALNLVRLDGDVGLVCRFTFANKVHGDLDNLVGGIMDALNGIAYKDDKQVKAINAGLEVTGENTIYVSVESLNDEKASSVEKETMENHLNLAGGEVNATCFKFGDMWISKEGY